ncbi:hypothetical protein JCGZ_13614 [Jatropha curcas]|uniref:Uncharacterized protein n=1 Tax=Jatropha curcas TaxID=180498 RepID=A0A067KAA7_JATCU|nr:hypothetical protein JCGZ_13614 [Jatropha curcas]
MVEPNIPVSEIEKMIEKIVVASLEKLMRSDREKKKVVIEDDEEAKNESEKKERVDYTSQDEFLQCLPKRLSLTGRLRKV